VQQASDAAHLIQTVIAKPVVVVFHSMGGYVALQINHTHPQLVLANVFIDVPLSAAGSNTKRLTDALQAAHSLAPLQGMVASMGALAPSEVRELLQAMMLTPPVEVAIGMLSGLEVVTEQIGRLLAEAVTKPSLAIWPGPTPMGGDPAWLREHYPELHQEFFDQVGHFVQLEAPTATNALLMRFIEEQISTG
jgi:pimeloyl-ACP methyl ester carboxylesterase